MFLQYVKDDKENKLFTKIEILLSSSFGYLNDCVGIMNSRLMRKAFKNYSDIIEKLWYENAEYNSLY